MKGSVSEGIGEPEPGRGVITLTTDFGLSDEFVGVMKGVMLGRCPWARLVDLTHDIPPQDVAAAARLLSAAWRYFPVGTVHLVVVDPGVGADRDILAIRSGGHFFVGPDNGALTSALSAPDAAAARVTDTTLFRSPVSRTFHGRDIFAPVAARIAAGADIRDLGTPADPAELIRLDFPGPRIEAFPAEPVPSTVTSVPSTVTSVPSTVASVPSAVAPVPSAAASVSSNTAPVPSATASVPSTAAPAVANEGRPAERERLVGVVTGKDRFGNLITNIDADILADYAARHPDAPLTVQVGDRRISGIAEAYAAAPAYTPLAIVGSRGFLEIAVNRGSAAALFPAVADLPVVIQH